MIFNSDNFFFFFLLLFNYLLNLIVSSLSSVQSRNLTPPQLPSRPAPQVPQCVALYDFDAQQPTDLAIKKGDIITLIKSEGNWWQGTLDGRTGDFPSNYVKMI